MMEPVTAKKKHEIESGLVFNVQKYSLHDGPGIRTTVFLKGCPLCCAWCHNPESRSASPELVLSENRCTACGECRRACPFGETAPGGGPMATDAAECTLCGQCAEACPTGARQIIGERRTIADIMEVVGQDRVFYEESGGGVTFSGGEPLSQPAFLKAMLAACRREGLRTAVDTCGFACTEVLLDIAGLSDLVLFDLKLMDDARHRQYTGVSNTPILANLRALARVHRNLWLRVPVIPGINDREEDMRAAAEFAAQLPGVQQVNLLAYHKFGLFKSRRLSQPYPLESVEPP
ncbi:MAG: glycyl-radical enzyme activating protein, partial [Verrucomicrobiota bacterium]